jgi:hypothetical protein
MSEKRCQPGIALFEGAHPLRKRIEFCQKGMIRKRAWKVATWVIREAEGVEAPHRRLSDTRGVLLQIVKLSLKLSNPRQSGGLSVNQSLHFVSLSAQSRDFRLRVRRKKVKFPLKLELTLTNPV